MERLRDEAGDVPVHRLALDGREANGDDAVLGLEAVGVVGLDVLLPGDVEYVGRVRRFEPFEAVLRVVLPRARPVVDAGELALRMVALFARRDGLDLAEVDELRADVRRWQRVERVELPALAV